MENKAKEKEGKSREGKRREVFCRALDDSQASKPFLSLLFPSGFVLNGKEERPLKGNNGEGKGLKEENRGLERKGKCY